MKSQRTVMVMSVAVMAGMVLALQAAAVEPPRPDVTPVANPAPSSKGTMSDADILGLLEIANTSDIEAGQVAQQKGSSPQVKKYGSRMSAEHASMLNEGAALAKHLMMIPALPEEGFKMIKEQTESMEDLRKKSGKDFDRAYIEHEIKAHQKVLKQVKEATNAADHMELKHLLETTRPALEEHLKEAQEIKRQLSS